LFRVGHEGADSLWKIALDDKGQVWGLKVEMIPPREDAPDPALQSGALLEGRSRN
jgi:hypothetical protein